MRRVMLAAPWALFAHVAAPTEIHAAADIAQCVEVAPEHVARGMSLAVENTCDFAVHCTLKWRVRCDGDAPDAAARNMSIAVDLASAGKRQLMASGEGCGERVWEITDDVWECKQVH